MLSQTLDLSSDQLVRLLLTVFSKMDGNVILAQIIGKRRNSTLKCSIDDSTSLAVRPPPHWSFYFAISVVFQIFPLIASATRSSPPLEVYLQSALGNCSERLGWNPDPPHPSELRILDSYAFQIEGRTGHIESNDWLLCACPSRFFSTLPESGMSFLLTFLSLFLKPSSPYALVHVIQR